MELAATAASQHTAAVQAAPNFKECNRFPHRDAERPAAVLRGRPLYVTHAMTAPALWPVRPPRWLVPARLGRRCCRRVARPWRSVIPILRARDVRHGPVLTVPS